MNPSIVRNPAVTQVVTPETITLTMSRKAAQALRGILASVRTCDLDDYELPWHVLGHLGDPGLVVHDSNGSPVSLRILHTPA